MERNEIIAYVFLVLSIIFVGYRMANGFDNVIQRSERMQMGVKNGN